MAGCRFTNVVPWHRPSIRPSGITTQNRPRNTHGNATPYETVGWLLRRRTAQIAGVRKDPKVIAAYLGDDMTDAALTGTTADSPEGIL